MATESFERMYNSFGMFAEASKSNAEKKIIPMSSGVNWVQANNVVRKHLKKELDYNLTYRNYGRSYGAKIVTDIISDIESKFSATNIRPEITISNGTCEGAWGILQSLFETKHLNQGDSVVIIGQSFPFYQMLSESFSLKFNEIIDDTNSNFGYLPSIDFVIHKLGKIKPKLLFLISPNNPLGESYNSSDLEKIKDYCELNEVKILVDRVCQMSWDSREVINNIFMDGINNDLVFIVDSFSKSESLAGLRTGFIVSSKKTADLLCNINKYRSLNPIVFSTPTLLLTQIASVYSYFKNRVNVSKYSRVISRNLNYIFSEYPYFEEQGFSESYFIDFLKKYKLEMDKKKKIFDKNFKKLVSFFGGISIKPLLLDAGFNVALSLEMMKKGNEVSDQQELAYRFGVGVITEDCFRKSSNERENFFIRIGLAIPNHDFEVGLKRIEKFYLK